MKLQSVLLVVLGAIALTSCFPSGNSAKNGDPELSVVSVGNDDSIGVPAYMTKATALNDEASLQYQNIFKGTYVIVLDENKQEFIDAYIEADSYDTTLTPLANYANIQVQLTSSKMEQVLERKEISYLKINGQEAATTEIEGKFEGVEVPISYFFTYVEGPNKLYLIMAWTLKDKRETYRKDFEKIAQSFQLKKLARVVVK